MIARLVLVVAAPLLLSSACGKPKKQPPSIPPAAPAELTTPASAADEEEPEDDDEDDGFGGPSTPPSTKSPSKTGPSEGAPGKTQPESPSGPPPAWAKAAATKIAAHAKGKRRAWDRLAELSDRFGPRPAGSKALEEAIDWSIATMKTDGLTDARREKVMIPNWRRGKESLRVAAPIDRELTVLGLGGTVGTKGTLRAKLLVVSTLEELDKRGAEAKGKIVLVNQVMPPYDHAKDDSGYGTAVKPRGEGASRAAKHGAVGLLIRSVTAVSLDTPHTGAMRYADGVPKIPAAAVTHEGAELLVRLSAKGPVEVKLQLGATQGKDVPSGNAIAELKGREKPDEVVVIGGHIDSWDVGDGASDDGAGCVMAMEAALMLEELDLVPRRTIRVVLFTNEEYGLRGGKAYFDAHKGEKHVAAIESDSGAGAPRGFGIASEDAKILAGVTRFAPLFEPLGANQIGRGWGGADISPLTEQGVLSLSLKPDTSHYFDLHHSPADTVDKIDPDHLQRNAAAFALMAYILAERE